MSSLEKGLNYLEMSSVYMGGGEGWLGSCSNDACRAGVYQNEDHYENSVFISTRYMHTNCASGSMRGWKFVRGE